MSFFFRSKRKVQKQTIKKVYQRKITCSFLVPYEKKTTNKNTTKLTQVRSATWKTSKPDNVNNSDYNKDDKTPTKYEDLTKPQHRCNIKQNVNVLTKDFKTVNSRSDPRQFPLHA